MNRKLVVAGVVAAGIFFCSNAFCSDTNITINATPGTGTGGAVSTVETIPPSLQTADEAIKLQDHAIKVHEMEEKKIEVQDLKKSADALATGNEYFKKGEYRDAVRYYEMAIGYDDANQAAHNRLIDARKKRDEQEIKTGVHYHNAMEYLRRSMRENAVNELVLQLKADPENEPARMKLNELEHVR
ncbi:MAG: hypothetical protein GXP53_03095 [Deltaproteobacteria bacterium]|nr:hypothetical protein [Deltaproteobacteria bacterium]